MLAIAGIEYSEIHHLKDQLKILRTLLHDSFLRVEAHLLTITWYRFEFLILNQHLKNHLLRCYLMYMFILYHLVILYNCILKKKIKITLYICFGIVFDCLYLSLYSIMVALTWGGVVLILLQPATMMKPHLMNMVRLEELFFLIKHFDY